MLPTYSQSAIAVPLLSNAACLYNYGREYCHDEYTCSSSCTHRHNDPEWRLRSRAHSAASELASPLEWWQIKSHGSIRLTPGYLWPPILMYHYSLFSLTNAWSLGGRDSRCSEIYALCGNRAWCAGIRCATVLAPLCIWSISCCKMLCKSSLGMLCRPKVLHALVHHLSIDHSCVGALFSLSLSPSHVRCLEFLSLQIQV